MSIALVGIEAFANLRGDEWIAKGMPEDIAYKLAAVIQIMAGKANQKYYVEIDNDKIEGDFISVIVANGPCYGKNLHSAVDAHPDDGLLDVYIFKNASKLKLLSIIRDYTKGNYRKFPDMLFHYRAKKIRISSDEVICMSIDGQNVYGSSIEYEVMPKAINFVCPREIDLAKLPRIYGKPKEGFKYDRL